MNMDRKLVGLGLVTAIVWVIAALAWYVATGN